MVSIVIFLQPNVEQYLTIIKSISEKYVIQDNIVFTNANDNALIQFSKNLVNLKIQHLLILNFNHNGFVNIKISDLFLNKNDISIKEEIKTKPKGLYLVKD